MKTSAPHPLQGKIQVVLLCPLSDTDPRAGYRAATATATAMINWLLPPPQSPAQPVSLYPPNDILRTYQNPVHVRLGLDVLLCLRDDASSSLTLLERTRLQEARLGLQCSEHPRQGEVHSMHITREKHGTSKMKINWQCLLVRSPPTCCNVTFSGRDI